jgi:hypothetical protein
MEFSHNVSKKKLHFKNYKHVPNYDHRIAATILEFATTLTMPKHGVISVETRQGKAGSQLSHNSIRITGFAPRSRQTTLPSSFNCAIKRKANRVMLDIGT